MRTVALIATIALAGCTAAQRQFIADSQRQQREQQAASQAQYARVTQIMVVPGDLPSRPYEILGQVEWPARGNITLFGSACGPDQLRVEAAQAYGTNVDAIIGYATWQDATYFSKPGTGQVRCGGTAVRFTDHVAPTDWRSNYLDARAAGSCQVPPCY